MCLIVSVYYRFTTKYMGDVEPKNYLMNSFGLNRVDTTSQTKVEVEEYAL